MNEEQQIINDLMRSHIYKRLLSLEQTPPDIYAAVANQKNDLIDYAVAMKDSSTAADETMSLNITSEAISK